MKTPVLIVNYKSYLEGTGKNAIELTKLLEEYHNKYNIEIAVAVSAFDIYPVSKNTKLPVLAQHIDGIEAGSHTGHLLPENAKEVGAVGSLINHSERRLTIAEISYLVERLKKLNMISVVCSDTISTSKSCAALTPDFVAVEPPELIGGDISVSTAKPEIIRGTVSEVKRISPDVKVLCGAGVKNKTDVKKALELGSEGILLASGIVKAKDKVKAITEILEGFR